MARAHELEPLERADAAQRHPAVAEITAGKRLLIQAAPKDNQQVLKIESQTLKVSTEGISETRRKRKQTFGCCS